MNSLIQALSFLTILPLKRFARSGKSPELSASLAWFPLVGLIPGGLAWLIAFYSPALPALTSFFIVLSGTVVTGALHLDGLADWADGLGARHRRDILRIMKDPHLGSFGAAALGLVLLGKYAALFCVLAERREFAALLLAPVIARWTLAMLASFTPYARPEGGTGRAFIGRAGKGVPILATLALAAVIGLVAPRSGALWALAGLAAAFLLRRHSMRRLRGITGDVLGAACELVELSVLVTASLMHL